MRFNSYTITSTELDEGENPLVRCEGVEVTSTCRGNRFVSVTPDIQFTEIYSKPRRENGNQGNGEIPVNHSSPNYVWQLKNIDLYFLPKLQVL